MEIFTVAFFGHRHIENILKVEDALYKHIKNLVLEKCYVEFLVGRNGDFDISASSMINRVKNEIRDDNSYHKLVLPYVTSEYDKNKNSFEKYYDDISIFDFSSNIYPKAVIGLRNINMVDSADLIICYINQKRGGAYNAVKYAKNEGKKIINIYDEIE